MSAASMFKYLLFCLLNCALLAAQADAEIYLVSVNMQADEMVIADFKNISKNKGYDNQPSFIDNQTLLYSSTRNGQTDILKYNLETGRKTWITDTSSGSEYSPLKIPGKNAFSAIRLDNDGLQRLYSHDLESGKSEMLLAELKVGYHVWLSDTILVVTALVEDRMDLIVANLSIDSLRTFQKNVGRSLHSIPKTKLVSYISKEHEDWVLKSLDPETGVTEELLPMPSKIEDMVWLADGTVLSSNGSQLMRADPKIHDQFLNYHPLGVNEFYKISRLAISPDQRYLALVSELSPAVIVQKQVEYFNSGKLNDFVSCFSENVLVQNFPQDTMYLGNKRMKENYDSFLTNNPDARVKVTKRIVISNKVIDAETATVAGKKHKQVAIYEVNNGRISSMTFLHEKEVNPKIEILVQQQLDAYNARDIDAFMNTYSKEIKLYNYPNQLTVTGKEKMRKAYESFFEKTPDLKCEIKNRIVIGNMVIDEEYITINANNISAVAVYEVADGKIAKVTFLR